MSKQKTAETKYVIMTFEDDVNDDHECSMEVIPALWLCAPGQAWWPSHVGSMQLIGIPYIRHLSPSTCTLHIWCHTSPCSLIFSQPIVR